jgi:hypothetical protein
VRYCLESLALQTFKDFEVIVSDNYVEKPCKSVFDEFSDERIRYVRPPSPLAMHDNWEFACNLARGRYVAVLIDKTVLRPSALHVMHAALKMKTAEIVSWWNEAYVPFDEIVGYGAGRYFQSADRPRAPYYFDPKKELIRRFSLDVRRGTEGVHYYWGKICFGAYHQDLIRRIKRATGRLFYPICPDYTSMLAALAYAKNALDLGQPMLISLHIRGSNGRMFAERDDYALAWIKNLDPSLQLLSAMPLKGLYTSIHNVVATDYVLMQQRIGEPMRHLSLNMQNLLRRAKEDLDLRTGWQDPSRRRDQYEIWNRCYSCLPIPSRARFRLYVCRSRLSVFVREILRCGRLVVQRCLRAVPPFLGIARSIVLRFRHASAEAPGIKTFDDIVEAARYGDEYHENSPALHDLR